MTSTGLTLDLRRAQHREAGVAAWSSKKAALAALRERGGHRERGIEVNRAGTWLSWVWVISRPDHFHGVTYLMTADGQWVAGRLTDMSPCWCAKPCPPTGGDQHAAPWARLQMEPRPALAVTPS